MTIGRTRSVGSQVAQIGVQIGNDFIQYQDIEARVKEMYEYILSEIRLRLVSFIRNQVPKRTGQLRGSLLVSLYSSSITSDGELLISLGSQLNYAQHVNNMPTWKVRHTAQKDYAHYGGWSGTIILSDSQAIGHFADVMFEIVDDMLTNLWQRGVDKYFEKSGNLGKELRKME